MKYDKETLQIKVVQEIYTAGDIPMNIKPVYEIESYVVISQSKGKRRDRSSSSIKSLLSK